MNKSLQKEKRQSLFGLPFLQIQYAVFLGTVLISL